MSGGFGGVRTLKPFNFLSKRDRAIRNELAWRAAGVESIIRNSPDVIHITSVSDDRDEMVDRSVRVCIYRSRRCYVRVKSIRIAGRVKRFGNACEMNSSMTAR